MSSLWARTVLTLLYDMVTHTLDKTHARIHMQTPALLASKDTDRVAPE